MQRALVEEALNRLPAAQLDLDRAIAREPTNYRPPLLLSRIDAEAGDVQQALDGVPARQGAATCVGVLRPAVAVTPTTLS